MKRLLILVLLGALVTSAPALASEEVPFSPDSEEAGWLWPAAFTFYSVRTAALDFPAAYFIDTPRVIGTSLNQKDDDTVSALVSDLQDPYLTVKDPIAAELRRRTGKDFGYSDSAPWLERQRSVARWAKWARKSKLK